MAPNPQVAFNSLRDFMTNFPLQTHRFFIPPPPQFFPGEQLERQYKAHIATLAVMNWSCHWLDESALAEWISEQPKISYDPVRDLYLAQQGRFVPFIQYNGDIGRRYLAANMTIAILSWLPSLWKLAIGRLSDLGYAERGFYMHYIFGFSTAVITTLFSSPSELDPANFGDFNLQWLDGTEILSWAITEGYKDILAIILWIWRDVIIHRMASGKLDDEAVRRLLSVAQNALPLPFYCALPHLSFPSLPAITSFDDILLEDISDDSYEVPKYGHQEQWDRVVPERWFQLPVPEHWDHAKKHALKELRRIFFATHVDSFYEFPTTALYKYITLNHLSFKAELDRFLNEQYQDLASVSTLPDHSIAVIVGYYLANADNLFLQEETLGNLENFLSQLQLAKRRCPIDVAIRVATYLIGFQEHSRDGIQYLIIEGFKSIHRVLFDELDKLLEINSQEMDATLAMLNSRTYNDVPRDTLAAKITKRLAEGVALDDVIVSRYLDLHTLLSHYSIPAKPQDYASRWNLNAQSVTIRITDRVKKGPLRWITKTLGGELAKITAEELERRHETRALGNTLRLFTLWIVDCEMWRKEEDCLFHGEQWTSESDDEEEV